MDKESENLNRELESIIAQTLWKTIQQFLLKLITVTKHLNLQIHIQEKWVHVSTWR